MTVYLSQATALRFANVAIANRDITDFRIVPIERRDPDTRSFERVFAVQIVNEFAAHRGWL